MNSKIQTALCLGDIMKSGWRDIVTPCAEKSQGHSSLIHNGKEQNVVVSAARIL